MPHRRVMVLRRHLAMSAAILVFAAALGAQTQAWKTFTYPPDGFSASFPSAPDIQKKPIPTDAGTFELRSYIAQDGDVALFIAVCDYGALAAGKDPDAMLQAAKEAVLKNANSHLVSDKKIALGIYHGVAFEAVSDQALFSARIYMAGSTLYETLVVAQLGKPYEDAAQFLDSFQLIARPGN